MLLRTAMLDLDETDDALEGLLDLASVVHVKCLAFLSSDPAFGSCINFLCCACESDAERQTNSEERGQRDCQELGPLSALRNEFQQGLNEQMEAVSHYSKFLGFHFMS
jgi:hypothetical protein